MKEVCFCSRRGEITDREPILDESGRWTLTCRSCGHTDYLKWFSEEPGLILRGEAKPRRERSVGQVRFAAR
jgi:hypothetical protein